MPQDFEKRLQACLEKLEKIYKEILKSQGYTRDVEKLKMLVELTREQVKNENPHSSAS